MLDIVIYQQPPTVARPRNTLAMIRNAGIEPHVWEYRKRPPKSAKWLVSLIERMGISPRDSYCVRKYPFP